MSYRVEILHCHAVVQALVSKLGSVGAAVASAPVVDVPAMVVALAVNVALRGLTVLLLQGSWTR